MSDIRKFIDMVTLMEMDWHEKSPLADILTQYPGKFIHFSRVNKLGVNPNKSHSDPHGVYFYPVDWIMNDPTRRVKQGDQWGFDWPYYFIADVRGANGIVLSQFTEAQLNQIAQRNGWWDYLVSLKRKEDEPASAGENRRFGLPNRYHMTNPTTKMVYELPSRFDPSDPSRCLWDFCDTLQHYKLMSWGKSLAGIDYIYDDNQGIINQNEPAQCVVLNPRALKILRSGENKGAARGQTGFRHWQHGLKKVYDALISKYGGEITWKNKLPTLSITVGEKNFRMEIPSKTVETWAGKLYLYYTFKRATGYFPITSNVLSNNSVADAAKEIGVYIDRVLNMKSDILFTPKINADDAKAYLSKNLFNNDFTWTETVDNSGFLSNKPDSSYDRNYAHLLVTGSSKKKIGDCLLEVRADIALYQAKFRPSFNIFVNEEDIFHSRTLDSYESNFERANKELLREFQSCLETVEGLWFDRTNSGYSRWMKFPREELWHQFIGWVIVNSGISFDGVIEENFQPFIKAYTTLDDADRDTLEYYISIIVKKL